MKIRDRINGICSAYFGLQTSETTALYQVKSP